MRAKRTGSKLVAVFSILLVTAAALLVSFRSPSRAGLPVDTYAPDAGQSYANGSNSTGLGTVPTPRQGGTVHGTVVDENDLPLRGIEVELIPFDKEGDSRWYATKRGWTNEGGEYSLGDTTPGEYLVAVLKRSAPDKNHPFVGAYYPDASEESSADRILVMEASPTELHPMRLRRLETATLKISVSFEDGDPPAWSNLLFHNLSYPNQAVIGDVAPGIRDGKGSFTLPKGFEYYARAKVDCDAGARIETRESRPVQRVKIADGFIPGELKLTIPGSSCRLWSPK